MAFTTDILNSALTSELLPEMLPGSSASLIDKAAAQENQRFPISENLAADLSPPLMQSNPPTQGHQDFADAPPVANLLTELSTALEQPVVATPVVPAFGASEVGSSSLFNSSADLFTSPDTPTPERVIGTDDRIQINNTTNDPWRRIARLELDGFLGTGALISPFHILTAGHNIYGKGDGWTNRNEIKVNLGQNGSDRFYGTAKVTKIRSFKGWTKDANWEIRDGSWKSKSNNYDMAVLTLDRSIGDHTGWFGYKYNTSNSYFKGLKVNTAGYPGDKPFGTMHRAYGPIKTVSKHKFGYNGPMDTAPGQSGSPVWQYDSDENTHHIVGVHVTGSSNMNYASRITKGKFEAIQDWIKTDKASNTPWDRSDLVSYDDWFSTSHSRFTTGTQRPGNSFQVRAALRNNGTANAGRFKVSFYASTNDIISTLDTKLGEVTVSSLSAFSRRDAVLNTRLPNNLASGNYYIGWIIDSTDTQREFEEGNNIGVIKNRRLRVSRSGGSLGERSVLETDSTDLLTGMSETDALTSAAVSDSLATAATDETLASPGADVLLTERSLVTTEAQTADSLTSPFTIGTSELAREGFVSGLERLDQSPIPFAAMAPVSDSTATLALI